jgi:hypothetical protein
VDEDVVGAALQQLPPGLNPINSCYAAVGVAGPAVVETFVSGSACGSILGDVHEAGAGCSVLLFAKISV